MNIINWVRLNIFKENECLVLGHNMEEILFDIHPKDSLIHKRIMRCKKCGIEHLEIYDAYIDIVYVEETGFDLLKNNKKWKR